MRVSVWFSSLLADWDAAGVWGTRDRKWKCFVELKWTNYCRCSSVPGNVRDSVSVQLLSSVLKAAVVGISLQEIEVYNTPAGNLSLCLSLPLLAIVCDLGDPRKCLTTFLSRLATTHSAGVLHNDVATRNVVLSSKGLDSRALLCDFGLSRFLGDGLQRAYCIDTDSEQPMEQEKWPVRQMPRESLIHPHALTVQSDSWMYGIFLHEVRVNRGVCEGLSSTLRLIILFCPHHHRGRI